MTPDAYCFSKRFEPAGPAAFHIDRHYLVYALSGTLRLEAQGLRWILPPARAALIAADHPIRISILTAATTASVLFAKDFMPAPRESVRVFELSPLARELIGECRTWGAESGPLDSYARRLFDTLASVVLRLADTPSPFVMPVPSSLALQRALTMTEELTHAQPSFAAIARATGQSPRALSRRFAEEMGMTWRQALRRMRLMQAVEALAMSDAPVTEIAMRVGYASLSAFNAAFRDLLGMTPTNYRRSFRITARL
ncbi:MAG: AraC family transcriptional regulator [Asticcacaulis sp.]|jgi:AraC-like DNA-binding protein|uniref:helix-turn-helix transcriptional regulator n=1 Tax=Asticcacaulis sp. TaxID=1872648 RepID=UPI003F7BC95E